MTGSSSVLNPSARTLSRRVDALDRGSGLRGPSSQEGCETRSEAVRAGRCPSSRLGLRRDAVPGTCVRLQPALALLVALTLPAVLYLLTLAPTVQGGDSAELATAAATLGIPHPPGYPLYVLLGRLWTFLLPAEDAGLEMNALSAAFALIAVGMLFRVVHLLTRSLAAAVAASWLLGLSYSFWDQAVVAETYTLEAALLAAAIWSFVQWRETGRPSWLVLGCACVGLGAAHRTSSLVLLPGVMVFLFANRRRVGRQWWLASGGLITPLLLYLYLPIRSAMGAPYVWGGVYSLAEAVSRDPALWHPDALWHFVSGQDFAPLLTLPPFDGGPEAWRHYLARISLGTGDYLWWLGWDGLFIGIPLGLVGIQAVRRRRPDCALLLVLGFAGNVAFFASYGAWDRATMLLPAHLLWAVFVGCGFAEMLVALRSVGHSRVAAGVAPASVALVALASVLLNGPLVSRAYDTGTRDRAEAMLATAEPGAVVIGGWADIAPLLYLQKAEGQREDIRLVQSWALDPLSLVVLVRSNMQERPVYFMSGVEVALRDSQVQTIPVGDWYRVLPRQEGNRASDSLAGRMP